MSDPDLQTCDLCRVEVEGRFIFFVNDYQVCLGCCEKAEDLRPAYSPLQSMEYLLQPAAEQETCWATECGAFIPKGAKCLKWMAISPTRSYIPLCEDCGRKWLKIMFPAIQWMDEK